MTELEEEVPKYRHPDFDSDSDSAPDYVREATVRKVWDSSGPAHDNHLLFGPHGYIDLPSAHPSPVDIFRLWQVYLDNVNPLLKVTHTPSLQGRIIEAAGNVTKIKPDLEALMFSIYCMAILSLTPEDCEMMFAASKAELLARYQTGCQQALVTAKFVRTSDRECLTAMYLYLVSVRPNSVPQSLSSVLGMTVRIAQRIGIHSESELAKFPPLEAELRRRLWWALVYFDSRVCELANIKTVTLNPTWDCKPPLNINDSDLRPESKESPTAQPTPTDAFFAVVRGELHDYYRRSPSYLDFTLPALKALITTPLETLDAVESRLESQYLRHCDPSNPMHFMTLWTTRGMLHKIRLISHHSLLFSPSSTSSSTPRTPSQRNEATSHALRMLHCDTQIMTSPLCRGFRWLNRFHFPFPAYLQIVQDTHRRPAYGEGMRRSWEVLSENYDAWFRSEEGLSWFHPIFRFFSGLVLRAWEGVERCWVESGGADGEGELVMPGIVAAIRKTVEMGQAQPVVDDDVMKGLGLDDFQMPPSVGMGMGMGQGQGVQFGMFPQDSGSSLAVGMYPGAPVQNPMGGFTNPLDWIVLGGGSSWDY